MDATYETNDFMGRQDSQGHWTEEFASVEARRCTIRDASSAENYAPEDQDSIGVAPAPSSGNLMQRLLVQAWLLPGPSDEAIAKSKLTYKTTKVGAVSLRCVTLDRADAKNGYQKRIATRVYCLDAERPIIRIAQVEYGMVVTYNSIAHFGTHVFAQSIGASQYGKQRGKLQVTKLVAAPELLQANLPKVESAPSQPAAAAGTKVEAAVLAGKLVSKVSPIYPIDSKQRHITGSVLLHAIISKEGNIESLEVVSAPAEDLADAAIQAVSQWKYTPYLLNGRPTEVDTVVTVNFTMN